MFGLIGVKRSPPTAVVLVLPTIEKSFVKTLSPTSPVTLLPFLSRSGLVSVVCSRRNHRFAADVAGVWVKMPDDLTAPWLSGVPTLPTAPNDVPELAAGSV